MTAIGGGRLPDRALRWVTSVLGPGTAVRAAHLLPGATSSTLHRIEVARDGRTTALVLRQFTNAEWLAEEASVPRHEAASLEKVRAAGVPAPELVALDEAGEHCGVPALLMTCLPGKVELLPADLDDWLRRLAEAILPVHDIEVGAFPYRYQPYNDLARLEPPRWSSVPDLWARAIDLVRGPPPEERACFIHRDYHPNNVLWQEGQVSGIVDWPNACRGAPHIDVAWCRGNLAGLYGVDAADRFLSFYCALAGASFAYHPYWDLIVAIEILPGPPTPYEGWIAHGIHDLTDEIGVEREDAYLRSIMARL